VFPHVNAIASARLATFTNVNIVECTDVEFPCLTSARVRGTLRLGD
jgi:hypothetical protein